MKNNIYEECCNIYVIDENNFYTVMVIGQYKRLWDDDFYPDND